MRGLHVVAVAALVAALGAPAAAAGAAEPPHTRGLSPESRELIALARERSAVVGQLIDALDKTDVVVYVTLSDVDRSAATGYLSFLVAAGGVRYLIVKIDWLATPPDRIVTLGHELQHALEVAAAPEVRDVRTFRLLYARIGWETHRGRYETDLARQTGSRVQRELAGFRPSR